MGALHQEEIRVRALELTDIEPTSSAMPEPDEFVWAKKAILPSFLDDAEIDALNGGTGAGGGGEGSQDAQLGTRGSRTGVGSLDDANSARDE